MAIIPRGENCFLVRVYIGRDPVTKERIEVNRTVHGPLTLAKKVEAQLKGQKESGHLLKTPRMALNTLLDLYLDSTRHSRSETTRDKDTMYFNYYVRPYIGHISLEKIDKTTIQRLFNFLLDKKKDDVPTGNGGQGGGGKGLSPVSVKNIRKVLSAAFNYAITERLITGNPAHKTKLPPVTGSSANSMTIEEAQAFVSVKDDFWYGDAFVFQLHTGLRPQELLALIWEDIDFERGTLRIERACKWIRGIFKGFGPPKCKRSERVIGLAPEHLELLRLHFEKQQEAVRACATEGQCYGEPEIKAWVLRARTQQAHLYASAGLIFAKPDGKVPNYTAPQTQFKSMLERAGIQSGRTNYRWYDLRHTHATFLLTLGLPDREVAERLGHSVPTLLSTYSHFIKSRLGVAAILFASLIPVNVNQCNSSNKEAAVQKPQTDIVYSATQLILNQEAFTKCVPREQLPLF